MQAARLVLLGLAIVTLAVACWLTGCGGKQELPAASIGAAEGSSATVAATESGAGARPVSARPRAKPVDPVVVIHTSLGDIRVQLFAEKASQTVDNFLSGYVKRQFYSGTIFHHVEPGSMVIAGGYTADLALKETRAPIYNESRNGLSNKRGMVAMIRDPGNTHSATSQFFINLGDNPNLDFQSDESDEGWGYCVFGQVTEGMEIVDRIAASQVAPQGEFVRVPAEPITIKSIEQIQ